MEITGWWDRFNICPNIGIRKDFHDPSAGSTTDVPKLKTCPKSH